MGAPSNPPPTRPSLARNSAMILAFQSPVSVTALPSRLPLLLLPVTRQRCELLPRGRSSHRCRVTGRSSRGKRLGRAVTETGDWNAKIIAELRANEGRVGGGFEGAPITLVHHRGRKSGREYVSPTLSANLW